jgi:hypothetical protein
MARTPKKLQPIYRRYKTAKEHLDGLSWKELTAQYKKTEKKYSTSLPKFFDKLIKKGEGGIIVFIDRDARPMYLALNLLKPHLNKKIETQLFPLSRQTYSPTFRMKVKKNYLKYHEKTNNSTQTFKKQMETGLSLSFRKQLEHKEEKIEIDIHHDLLKQFGILKHDKIVLVDTMTFGSAALYLKNLIEHYHPEKKVDYEMLGWQGRNASDLSSSMEQLMDRGLPGEILSIKREESGRVRPLYQKNHATKRDKYLYRVLVPLEHHAIYNAVLENFKRKKTHLR